MLELKSVGYQVEEEGRPVTILKDVTLTIEDHQFIVITGPNGGGKTSLARIIMGLVPPTSGSIFYNGQDITQLGVTERARLGISYGFQQPPRFKGIRVRDLLELSAGSQGLTREACCQYLTRVGLCADDYVDREVDASLSGGEVKRIEIATILARQSGLMIFDEPEAGIDLWSFSRLIDTFQDIRQQRNVTLLVISHQERIISLADEIILVAEGEIRQRGPKEEIFPLILSDTVASCCYMKEGAQA